MDLELLKHAKGYIEKMANGINPITGKSVSSDDTLNNIRISRCLFYVNNILGEVIVNKGISKVVYSKKDRFYLSNEEINKYIIDEDLPISYILKKINELITNENMNKLKLKDLYNWLINCGLIKKVEYNGKNVKRPTEIGKDIGIYLEHRIGVYGEYDIVMYSKKAQEFIIDNFSNLLEFINR